jgi:phage repressor protein C with HTH and peptisase S24 domain
MPPGMGNGIIGDRIKELSEKLGLSQSALAEKVGVKQPTIARLISGEQAGSRHIDLIAKALHTSPGYLRGEIDDPGMGALQLSSAEVALQFDLVEVREIDFSFGMGGQFIDSPAVQESTVHFPRAWLKALTSTDPSQLVFTRGDGDSMMPTINSHDVVLIDISQRSINRQDHIWAVAYGEIGMIKRIRAMPDGSYKIMSDNEAVPDEIAVDGEMHVIGRVVAALRRF